MIKQSERVENDGPRVVGLHAGAGGFLCAANMLGMNVVGNVSNWPRFYNESVDLSLHTRTVRYDGQDDDIPVRYLNKLGQIDIICGNPPCQGFSQMVKAGTDRGEMLNEFFVQF